MIKSIFITYFKYIITTINTYITNDVFLNNDYNQFKGMDASQD